MPSAHQPSSDYPQGVLFENHDTFHRRDWLVQRLARAIFVLIILAAAAGLFGGGPLSRTSTADAGTQLDYDRFIRQKSRLVFHAVATGDTTTLRIDGLILPTDQLVVRPEPVSQTASNDARTLTFETVPGRPFIVELEWTPQRPGVREGTVAVDDARLNVWSLVYP